ncbi:hypothetical protein C6P40_003771 [Pichia californica]|uniref:FCP1 homology domain-containing protein n=1 Tax=Pichia californica TaxID=460514 RepID=A0A9P7BE05_9ASCO|nr:hypothetical protein C6P42_003477 [[Candida] californica]KAG0686585.1 hypothetical protein C6P40_003771 [[Candida] californica]
MSFLSSLFCCFDAEDSTRKENNLSKSKSNSTHQQKLTKTQSNLQKALTNTNQRPLSTTTTINKSLISNNNNNNNTTTTNTVQKSNSTSKLSPQSNTLKENTSIPVVSTDNSKHQGSQNMSNSDSSSTTHIQSNDYKDMVEDITDLKDLTDSSKDEDDNCQIHEHQTQNTDETAINNNKMEIDESNNPTPINEVATNNSFDNNNNNNSNNNSNNNVSNLISNISSDSNLNSANYNEQLYEEQFGTDLTAILPDQAVASSGWLLNEQPKELKGRKCLVLDLDETLVHSSFKYVRQCDFVIPVEIEDQIHNVYVIKRPGVDQFLKRVGELYEVVVFTASVSRYGDPLLDILDSHKSIHHRLFRDSCYNYQGNYIKNLSQMGRPLEDLIIIDNSPASYVFHPQHAVPISSWFSDSHDCELPDLLPFLEDLAHNEVDDIRLVLDINI